MGKSADDTGEQTQTDKKRHDKYLFRAALLCRLRGETQPGHGKRICTFPLFWEKGRKRTQQIDIYYSYVGIVDIPTDEEMREMEQEYMQRTKRQTA